MKYVVIGLAVVGVLGLSLVSYAIYMQLVANPAVLLELRDDPSGERAKKVMVLALPSGKRIPVNYLREGELVFAGADGSWWKELAADGTDVELLIRGENLRGRARAVEDDPAYTLDVFKRLRPTSYRYLGGTLVEIRLAAAEARVD
jgi:hypothetical protein